jgi:hypothetical protein
MAVRLGALLIALSVVPWLALAVLPFLGLGSAAFAAGGGLIVGAEVAFWLGLLLVGPDTWILARSHGWRRVPGALWRVLRHATIDCRPPGRDEFAAREGDRVRDSAALERQTDESEDGASKPD